MKKFLIKNLALIDKRSASTFLTVGFITAVINFSLFTLLFQLMHFDYRIAISIAYICSIIFHFTANRYFTFRSHGANLLQHMSRYLVMVGFNYLVTITIICIVVDHLYFSPYLGVLFAIAGTVWFGYILSKFWVFRCENQIK